MSAAGQADPPASATEARLELAGLSIVRLEADQPDPGGHDLLWRVFRVAELPFDAGIGRSSFVLRRAPAPEQDAIDYLFGYDDAVRCSFRIHGDGSVTSTIARDLAEHDLTGLFSEAILRVVLRQRGLPSLHAAALAKDGHAILVMGDKGAGKSTLSAALLGQGWVSIADDLVRVEDRDGWVAFPGARLGKLHADSAAALGLAPDAMTLRWTEAPEWDRLHPKHLLSPAVPLADPLRPLPLAAIFVLGQRHRDGAAIEARPASPLARAQALLRHATPDPLAPNGPPPRFAHDAIAGLARHVPICEVSLVDALDRAGEAAAAVDALAMGLIAPGAG